MEKEWEPLNGEDYEAALRDLKGARTVADVETVKTERARVMKEDRKCFSFSSFNFIIGFSDIITIIFQ